MNNIRLTVEEEAPISLDYVEARIKPEQSKIVTPTDNGFTVLPDDGCVLSSVVVNPVPDATDDITIMTNGDHDVRKKRTAHVQVLPVLQSKTVTPGEQAQTVTADEGYDGMGDVTVEQIPSQYIIPSGSMDITENANGINVAAKETVNVNVPVPSDTTATAADITLGKTVYIGGVKTTGTNDFVKPLDGFYLFDSLDSLGYMSRMILGIDVIWNYFFTNLKTAFPGQVTVVVYSPTTTEIQTNAFNGAVNILTHDFRKCTSVPTLISVSAYGGMNVNGVIVVPDDLVAAWKTATNWVNYANKIIGATEYDNS